MPLTLCAELAPVIGGSIECITVRANFTTAQTDTALVTAGAAERLVVTRITAAADKANSVNTSVIIGFGATTTPTGVGAVAGHPGIDPGGGFTIGNGGGILGQGQAGEDLRLTSSVPTGGSISVYVTYHLLD